MAVLCLRVALPAMPIAAPGADLAAALGEHALCLAAAASGAAVPEDGKQRAPIAPATDHDPTHCCLWHAAAGVALLPGIVVEPVLFWAARTERAFAGLDGAPGLPPGIARARGPPPSA